jgi:hypothetical protein
MADPPSYPGTGGTSDTPGAQHGGGRAVDRPRWKVAAIWAVVIALLAVMVILHLTGVVGSGTNG